MKCEYCNGTGQQIDQKELGSRLRIERERQGITQKVMADRVGVSAGFLCDLENGRRAWLGRVIKTYQMVLASGVKPKSFAQAEQLKTETHDGSSSDPRTSKAEDGSTKLH